MPGLALASSFMSGWSLPLSVGRQWSQEVGEPHSPDLGKLRAQSGYRAGRVPAAISIAPRPTGVPKLQTLSSVSVRSYEVQGSWAWCTPALPAQVAEAGGSLRSQGQPGLQRETLPQGDTNTNHRDSMCPTMETAGWSGCGCPCTHARIHTGTLTPRDSTARTWPLGGEAGWAGVRGAESLPGPTHPSQAWPTAAGSDPGHCGWWPGTGSSAGRGRTARHLCLASTPVSFPLILCRRMAGTTPSFTDGKAQGTKAQDSSRLPQPALAALRHH